MGFLSGVGRLLRNGRRTGTNPFGGRVLKGQLPGFTPSSVPGPQSPLATRGGMPLSMPARRRGTAATRPLNVRVETGGVPGMGPPMPPGPSSRYPPGGMPPPTGRPISTRRAPRARGTQNPRMRVHGKALPQTGPAMNIRSRKASYPLPNGSGRRGGQMRSVGSRAFHAARRNPLVVGGAALGVGMRIGNSNTGAGVTTSNTTGMYGY